MRFVETLLSPAVPIRICSDLDERPEPVGDMAMIVGIVYFRRCCSRSLGAVLPQAENLAGLPVHVFPPFPAFAGL